MLRVLHLSDVHVPASLAGVPAREFTCKRLLGLANLSLRRGRRFADAAHKLRCLAQFAEAKAADLVICTGDYTALGTEPELAAACRAVLPLTHAPLGFCTLPGNHDIYARDAQRDNRFARFFGDFLGSDAPDLCTYGGWPVVKLPSPELAVVLLDCARPNPPWSSTGHVPDAQLVGLQRILRDARLAERWVIVALHYAPCLQNGGADKPWHKLTNAAALLEACAPLRRGMLLCGHVHHAFHVTPPGLQVPLFCAGSTTQRGRESFWWFELEGEHGSATQGGWQDGAYTLQPEPAVRW